ncbi:calcium-dependent secretion activator 1-like [Lethenteron reissneri]|uniref:calcium-dependent secretion activator 1-like n=1 Tax=Lethenteron reissneri TaxID=7753 RepID=UPI002AB7B0A9|nr:calcium-dependent secretion activator 1-like [Lethenteron reissneri]
MLEPSSSDEESSELSDFVRVDLDEAGDAGCSSDCASLGGPVRSASPAPSRLPQLPSASVSRSSSLRSSSPSPSVSSSCCFRDDGDEDRRRRMQLYVFVSRCVAYPFNAKQVTDMARRQPKVNKQQLMSIKERFTIFLQGDSQIVTDEAFVSVVKFYYEDYLKSDRVARIVQSGGWSANDFREVFKNYIEKRVRQMPEIAGLTKETVLSSWMTKFDKIFMGDEAPRPSTRITASSFSDLILSKDQLYEMFQHILGIKKLEHQLIFNASQLDHPDEQVAQIRREMDQRQKVVELIAKRRDFPAFVRADSSSTYVGEQRSSINLLVSNLESLPVSRGHGDTGRLQKPLKRYYPSSLLDPGEDSRSALLKSEIALSFTLEVVVMEVLGLRSLTANRTVYCTMEVEGGEKLQTEQAEASTPKWDTQGDFRINVPLPLVKVKLFAVNSRKLALEDKELGRVILQPMATATRVNELHALAVPKNSVDQGMKIKLGLRMDKPQNMKHSGYLWAQGKNVWKKWKKRYFVLVQVSQCTFAICSYRERKAEPQELMLTDGFTVDYTEPLADVTGGRAFFRAVKEGDSLHLASDDDQDCVLWVQALCRATGQSHKPLHPSQGGKLSAPGGTLLPSESDRASKYGIEELIWANPSDFDHDSFFEQLQRSTLEHRLSDSISCLGWLSPGQVFVLDEYCARYGVRGCHRHLCFLNDLLEKAESGTMIDPTLLHYSFAFCASHVFGNRPDGFSSVTVDEMERYNELRGRLRSLLENQIAHFRYCFPFGRPEGALKATISLLERVLMKDMATTVPPAEMEAVLRSCLENAAFVNYTRLSEYAQIEDKQADPTVDSLEGKEGEEENTPSKKLEGLINLAELCIDVLQQNDDYHAEAFALASELFEEHAEMFWKLFSVDMDDVLDKQPEDNWDALLLFQLLNDYLRQTPSLNNGKFHEDVQAKFSPMVVRYVDLMEASIAQSVHSGFAQETWALVQGGSATSNELLWKLNALQAFIQDLKWPEVQFSYQMDQRLKLMANEMIGCCVSRTSKAFQVRVKKLSASTDLRVNDALCTMLNVLIDTTQQSSKLCCHVEELPGHSKAEIEIRKTRKEVSALLIDKFVAVLKGVLKKLARFDEGTFLSTLLSLTKPGMDLADSYVTFVRQNQEIFREKLIEDDYIQQICTDWYISNVRAIDQWLKERKDMQLHPHQLKILNSMTRMGYRDFQLQGVPEKYLKCTNHVDVQNRLIMEETSMAVQDDSSHDSN